MGTAERKLFEREWARAGVMILKGGGDGGVIWIGPNGVTTIGPWDPLFDEVRESVQHLTRVLQSAVGDEARIDTEQLQQGRTTQLD